MAQCVSFEILHTFGDGCRKGRDNSRDMFKELLSPHKCIITQFTINDMPNPT